MLVALAIFPVTKARRPFVLTSLAACAIFFVAAFAGTYRPEIALNPVRHVHAVYDELRTLASRDRRGAEKSVLRQSIEAPLALPAAVLDAVGRRSMAFWPSGLGSAVYAFDLNWRPPPVFEPNGAYTPGLDALEAEMLRSSRAPGRIVRYLTTATDNRVPTFESPLGTLAIFCRYRELMRQQPWQVLARGTDRCGAARALSTVEAAWGEQVTVPTPSGPGMLVVARVGGTRPQGFERLAALVLRPHRRFVSLDGGDAVPLMWETAQDGVLLSAPRAVDYGPPFNMAVGARTIAVSREGGQPNGRLRYEFLEIPIDAARG